MGSPSNNIVVGSVMGTGADLVVDTVGFRPKKISGFNSDGDTFEWQSDMADDSMFKRINSSGVGSVVSSDGVTPRPGGFALGADADVNQADKRVYYTVWCE